MRIVTFNVNGVRSWYDHYRTCKSWTFDQTLDSLSADIICIQETKANERAKVDTCILHPHRYKAHFGFPRRPKKIGHAGVAIFCKYKPTMVCDCILDCGVPLEFDSEDAAILRKIDGEGRFIMCAFGPNLLVINVYCTNDGGENEEIILERREERRVLFDFLKLLVHVKKGSFENVLLMGDFNVVYHPIDHCDYAKSFLDQSFNDTHVREYLYDDNDDDDNGKPDNQLFSQFYDDKDKPIRRWFFKWISEDDLVDVFRLFHPLEPFRYTCWNTKVSARVSNHGTRIDTILYAGRHADDVLTGSDQMNEYQGSDHCPVWVDISVEIQEGIAKGGQSKLTAFFSSANSVDIINGSKNDATMETRPAVKKSRVSLLDYVRVQPQSDSSNTSTVNNTNDGDDESCDKKDPTSSPLKSVKQSENWSALFKEAASRRKPPPLCPAHQKECILLRVSKKGPNTGRQFYICSVPVPDRCDFFQWLH